MEFLEHNELELAFDCLAELGDDLDLPLSFWRSLDRAARETRLYSDALHNPPLTGRRPLPPTHCRCLRAGVTRQLGEPSRSQH
ncbi:hypothetical protein ABZZ17_39595 [Streptomyces sp. NPDC006512]|uniref:hypothetical protein n=1 Tax=Streptomyces sp. NPDC006512 TaxID=3154307 RepID=UPI0033B1D0E6